MRRAYKYFFNFYEVIKEGFHLIISVFKKGLNTIKMFLLTYVKKQQIEMEFQNKAISYETSRLPFNKSKG